MESKHRENEGRVLDRERYRANRNRSTHCASFCLLILIHCPVRRAAHGVDLSGVVSVQGFHGGAGRVCALLLTFLSAPNHRSSGYNETINWARGLDIFLSCDTKVATIASTPGLSPTPNLCPPEKMGSLNLADIEHLYCLAVRLSGFRLYKSTNSIGKTLPCLN
jgi:hypothetical protein